MIFSADRYILHDMFCRSLHFTCEKTLSRKSVRFCFSPPPDLLERLGPLGNWQVPALIVLRDDFVAAREPVQEAVGFWGRASLPEWSFVRGSPGVLPLRDVPVVLERGLSG